jgi:hypothetical protein
MLPKAKYIQVKKLIDENQRTPGFPQLANLLMQQESIGELVDVAVSKEPYPYPQYASWLLLHVARKDFSLVSPYNYQIIDCILASDNPSVLRNLMGVCLCLPLADHKQGYFLDRLLTIINNPNSKPGLVYYTLRKLTEFVERYPDLQKEIELILELREEMNVKPNILAWNKILPKKKKKQ